MKKNKIEYYGLWVKYQREKNLCKKNKIRNQFVEIYYPLVQKIAYGLAKKINWKKTPEELSSMGVDGLYIAIGRFSLEREVTFPTYASRRIKGSMLDGIRKEDVIPRSVRMNHNTIERARVILESEKGRKVLEYEVIEMLGIDNKEYTRNRKKFHPVTFSSLDGSDIISFGNQEDYKQDSNQNIADNSIKAPDSYIVRKEFFNKLLGKSFSKVEQKIIYYYYYKDLTMDGISRKLKLSESRVSQIHKDLLPRLQDKILRNPKYFGEDICNIISECNDRGQLFL